MSCNGQNSQNTEYFEGTRAYELAKAVERGDTSIIRELVEKDSTLLKVHDPVTGSNCLSLAIDLEQFGSFKKLLELGTNPNAINPLTQYSVLMEAFQPFGNQFEWRREHKYAKLLLEHGANPNYAVERDFINEKGHHISATSPLMEASEYDLDAVKLLLKYGANPHKKLQEDQSTPFSRAVRRGKIDIVNFYIDSVRVDVHQPMATVIRKPKNERVTFYIQDYVVNKFTKARLTGNTDEVERLKRENPDIEKANEDLWQLIQKLKGLGVNFKDYNYKLI